MAAEPQVAIRPTLDEFLRMPGIDDRPYLEYVDGEVIAKVSPQGKHSRLAGRFFKALTDFAEPRGLGEVGIVLRFTFGGRSIVADLGFLKAEHLAFDEDGEVADVVNRPPDVHVEILSPDQSRRDAHRNLTHSAAHGCGLGLLVHPYRRTVDVYRPGMEPERLADDGVIDFAPVLPGLTLGVAEVFGWLKGPGPGAGGP